MSPGKLAKWNQNFTTLVQGVDYPRPIVDLKKSSMLAKEKFGNI